MAILWELVVVEYVLPAEEPIFYTFISAILIDFELLLIGVLDFNVLFDNLVVAELGGVSSIWEGDLDTSEKKIVLIVLKLIGQDGMIQLLAAILMRV